MKCNYLVLTAMVFVIALPSNCKTHEQETVIPKIARHSVLFFLLLICCLSTFGQDTKPYGAMQEK